MKKFALAIHGGAGTLSKSLMSSEKEKLYKQALYNAIEAGLKLLKKGASSLDSVTACIIELENSQLFNAGKGSLFTNEGTHEMDAAIMYGKDGMAGAVSGVRNIVNPILLARTIMEKSEHVMLSGKGAEMFAELNKIETANEKYFYDEFRFKQWQAVKDESGTHLDHSVNIEEKKFGTVGAVALDMYGNLAAGTSTGGMTNKRFNRIGDTPIIGSGTYANNRTCAVSCTGHGEYFMRAVAAYDISAMMEYKIISLKDAADIVVHQKLYPAGGEGGLIAIDKFGNISMPFNSEGMYRACVDSDSEINVMIY